MLKYFLAISIALAAFTLHGQGETIKWINENAHPLNDLSFLSNELKDKTVVALGEASHGTHEFYAEKGRLIQYMVTNLGYKLIGFEYQKSLISPINQYLRDGAGDLKKLMEGLHLYNTTEIFDVFQWIRNYNKTASPKNKVIVFGYDHQDFWYDPTTRDKYMTDTIVDFLKTHPGKSIIWAHNLHIAKDTTMTGVRPMGSYLKQEYGDKYYALCFDTFIGSVNVWSQKGEFEPHEFKTQEGSYSRLMATAKAESFFLSYNSKINPLVGTRNRITHIQSNWQARMSLPIKPGVDFDGVVFIRNTSPSVQLVVEK